MPEKILGLDIGRNSIKAVQVMAGIRGYEVARIALVDIDDEGGTEEALKKLFKKIKRKSARPSLTNLNRSSPAPQTRS
jgi:Tfp pilus assembly PilM family ATPase